MAKHLFKLMYEKIFKGCSEPALLYLRQYPPCYLCSSMRLSLEGARCCYDLTELLRHHVVVLHVARCCYFLLELL